ncbi:MAG TPA: carboxypeptidase-like regulatory domain-containing protein, partial [Balneolales bacterium]|nr:carboxypeptidase-like regulatory domain-containing protein [Balneolales bacterium]
MKKIRYIYVLFMIALFSCGFSSQAFSNVRLSNRKSDSPYENGTNNAMNTTKYSTKAILSNSSSQLNSKKQQEKANFTVKGKVTDADTGHPLPGVNVYVKGTTIGTSTNPDGQYTLDVPSPKDTLVYSFIGYNSQTVPVNSRHTINIQLATHVISGQQVVVVGYGTQKKKDLTSSISSVSSKQIENNPVQQVAQALQGKVAGVQIVQNSGTPGSGMMIRVRGTGTVNNSEPLYVVDGNPDADPTDIDPSNIKSIQILKSAAAAAIYGSRGANGVILITTKQ